MECKKILDNSKFICGGCRELIEPKEVVVVVEAIDYKVNQSCIRGFKFRLEEEKLPWIIEEYGLEDNTALGKR